MEPFDIAKVNTATVTFRLEKDDNVDFKFEAGRFGSPERVEAWVVRKRLRGRPILYGVGWHRQASPEYVTFGVSHCAPIGGHLVCAA